MENYSSNVRGSSYYYRHHCGVDLIAFVPNSRKKLQLFYTVQVTRQMPNTLQTSFPFDMGLWSK